MPPAQYEYTALDAHKPEIRLISVLPSLGPPESAVKCTIETYTIKGTWLSPSKNLPFETISYVWGDANKREDILVDEKVLNVAANTANVLRRFRLETEERLVWVDGICINQNDLEERGRQVALMDEIYRSGEQGLVWLGEDNEFAERAAGVLAEVLADVHHEFGGSGAHVCAGLTAKLYDRYGGLRYASTGFDSTVDFRPLLQLYSSPWFRRLWDLVVVQEAVIPITSAAYSGSTEYLLQDLLTAAAWIQYRALHLPFDLDDHPGLNNAASMFELNDEAFGRFSTEAAGGLDFADLLLYISRFQCSEDKDYIFGLWGLWKHRSNLLSEAKPPSTLAPDYKRSLGDIMVDATRYSIYSSGSHGLDFLAETCNMLAGYTMDRHQSDGFPSWVPAWHKHEAAQATERLPFPDHPDNSFVGYPRVASLAPAFHEKGLLALAGFHVSIVQTTTDVFGPGYDYEVYLTEVTRIIAWFKTDTERMVAYITTAGVDAEGEHWEGDDAVAQYRALRHCLPLAETREDIRGQPDHGEAAHSFVESLDEACSHRRCFVTGHGQGGIGPQTIEPGDVVVIIYGCHWPVMLRPRAEPGHYDVRGIAYIYGITAGTEARKHIVKEKDDDIYWLH